MRHFNVRVPTSIVACAAFLTIAFVGSSSSPRAAGGGKNGSIVVSADTGNGAGWQLYSIDPSNPSNPPVQLTHLTPNPNFDAFFPSFSPDGSRLAFAYASPTDAGPNLYVADADGSNVTKLTTDDGAFQATWSADGTTLVYSDNTTLTGLLALKTIAADGSGRHTTLTGDLENNFFGASTPNGREIILGTQRGGVVSSAWVMKTDGSGSHALTKAADEFCPNAISPSGRRVLMTKFCIAPLPTELWDMSVEGSGIRQLTNPPGGASDINANYAPDGSKIAFASNRANPNVLDLWIANADGSNPALLVSGLMPAGECGDGNCITPTWGKAR